MKNKFYCQKCQSIFETEGRKVEYYNPIYGQCWKRVANCPACKKECDERSQKSSSKKRVNINSYVNELKNRGGRCNPGGGCCS